MPDLQLYLKKLFLNKHELYIHVLFYCLFIFEVSLRKRISCKKEATEKISKLNDDIFQNLIKIKGLKVQLKIVYCYLCMEGNLS